MLLDAKAFKVSSNLIRVTTENDKLVLNNKKGDQKVRVKENKIEKKVVDIKLKNNLITKFNHDNFKACQTKASILQTVSKYLGKDREILDKMQNLVRKTDFNRLSRDEKVEVQEKLIRYVDDINKISHSTKFEDKELLSGDFEYSDNNNKKLSIKRIDSETLGLSTKDISKLTLDSVRVAGESYMPPYTFDVTNEIGAGVALSVIGSAITRIDQYMRETIIDINELELYPKSLDYSDLEYSAETKKIRNIDVARRMITSIQSSIRAQINQVQTKKTGNARLDVLRLIK